jgi:hypothetical protein
MAVGITTAAAVAEAHIEVAVGAEDDVPAVVVVIGLVHRQANDAAGRVGASASADTWYDMRTLSPRPVRVAYEESPVRTVLRIECEPEQPLLTAVEISALTSRKGAARTAPFFTILMSPPFSTTKRRASPAGAVRNNGKVRPVATGSRPRSSVPGGGDDDSPSLNMP